MIGLEIYLIPNALLNSNNDEVKFHKSIDSISINIK